MSRHDPTPLTEEEEAALPIGARVVLGISWPPMEEPLWVGPPFAVVSAPGDAGHPQLYPPVKTQFYIPPDAKTFLLRDRRHQ